MGNEEKPGQNQPEDDITSMMWIIGILLLASMIGAYFIAL